MNPVDYNQIAPTYDQRYQVRMLDGIAAALGALVRESQAGASGAVRVLEVGCGTGRWLAELQAGGEADERGRQVYGLDLSMGMLQQARLRPGPLALTRGQARQLPFPDGAFDLVFCVNALHHFDPPETFVREARRLLKPGGALAIAGMDPHSGRDRWYLYDFFAGTLAADLARFPSSGTLLDWTIAAGFAGASWHVAERIVQPQTGRAVLADPFLQRHGTSQLALLSDAAYAEGLRRIEARIAEAEARGETLVFPVDISLVMVVGRLE